jgi:hypothetical protein
MAVQRTDIEKALDELISNEEGMRFQGIAVVLAKQQWPEFIACERKKDLGLDAYANSSISTDGIGKGLACSLTATLGKIKNDAEKVKKHFDDVKILVFATPQQITNYTAKSWIDDIRETLGYELIIVPREDIITSLMLPSNAPICHSQLRIPVSVESEFGSVVERTCDATSELTANWLKHPRISGRPLIALKAVRIAQEARSDEVLSLNEIQLLLTECRRVVLEAPAGRGKTTALLQLATRDQGVDRVSFLIDLREWADSGLDILDFIASSPEFRSHGISAEDLAKLTKVTHISFLLNGWNEVSASVSERAEVALRRLERSFPAAGIIVATRNHNIIPPLPGAIRAELLPLTGMQRREYLQKRVGSRAAEIISKIENDPVLDELTQTFLFLAEVATIFESGRPIPPTKMGVLCEV